MRCRRSMSPYSIDTIAPGGALRCQESTRVLKPSHDSRPVSESRSCVALRASRRAKRARRRTVNSSKLGSSGRLKMMSAPAGPPRAISGTATSLQAICPPLVCLSLLVATGLRVSMARRASSSPTIDELLAREREVAFRAAPDGRAILRAGIWRWRRCSRGAGKPRAKRFPCCARACRPLRAISFLPTSPVLRCCCSVFAVRCEREE